MIILPRTYATVPIFPPERNFRDPQEMFAFTPRIRDMAQLTVHDSAGFAV